MKKKLFLWGGQKTPQTLYEEGGNGETSLSKLKRFASRPPSERVTLSLFFFFSVFFLAMGVY
jgi:hypothetical protein